ncbi:LysR family transcriptional regulator [Pantoea sp. Z09]|uniref:LysR family transcriptional regulator n=1 Tax=Pantoea sp. Z09 TaxID=2886821 RepID=UPI001EFC955E|nr:LysR family transcriptional regulator [Pantoea sp. Z09]
MAGLSFSFAQIEAFSTVAALGTVSQAARQLGKDRATLSELIEFLEAALGYKLFARQGRMLVLTPEGQRLKRQAALLMQQAQAFDAAARHVRQDISAEISLVYDPFVPRPFLCGLIAALAESNIRVSAWSAAREEAEAALASGAAQLALCQARNRSLGSEMAWRSVGLIELDFYAAAALFPDEQPVSLFALASQPQLVMHPAPDGVAAKQGRIADRAFYTNDRALLRHLLESGQGWAFLPKHFAATSWHGVEAIDVEVGNLALSQMLVMLWKPGMAADFAVSEAMKLVPEVWAERQG